MAKLAHTYKGSRPQPSSPIIYASTISSSFVIDIPISISLAQYLGSPPEHYPLIRSTAAPEVPYQSTEPKSERAKANVLARNGEPCNIVTNEEWLKEAWKQLRSERMEGAWCFVRSVATGEMRSRKRKIAGQRQSDIQEKHKFADTNSERSIEPDVEPDCAEPKPPLILSTPNGELDMGIQHTFLDVNDLKGRLVVNSASKTVKVSSLLLSPLPTTKIYFIPPKASFFQGIIDRSIRARFLEAADVMIPHRLEVGAEQSHFDVVVLDPPWQNRSVRNSQKYPMMPKRLDKYPNPLIVLRELLGKHIARNGTVACWITNKASVRVTALQLFDHWGVQLVEELVWLKVTREGLPVLDIEGLWRKPYEVCLVGRRSEDRGLNGSKRDVERRLMVAVPDGHSRKPSLKAILARDDEDFRGLEMFARSLTAGWCALGDDVLSSAEQSNWAYI